MSIATPPIATPPIATPPIAAPPFAIDRLVLIGVGLIGGSLAQALKRQAAVTTVVGVDNNQDNLQQALELQTIDCAYDKVSQALEGADMVVLAVPVLSISTTLKAIKPYLNDRLIITDVGSVKGAVVAQARAILGSRFAQFVAGHPIAGSENSGVKAAFSKLFANHRVILTPTAETDNNAIEVVSKMWTAVGATVELMSAEQHDKILAVTSHLPHVLAYALLQFLHRQTEQDEYLRLAAGGLYDFTRIASSDPAMWRDICMANKQHLSQQIRAFAQDLEQFAVHIENANAASLQASFATAKQARAQVADFRQQAK